MARAIYSKEPEKPAANSGYTLRCVLARLRALLGPIGHICLWQAFCEAKGSPFATRPEKSAVSPPIRLGFSLPTHRSGVRTSKACQILLLRDRHVPISAWKGAALQSTACL